MCGTNVCFLTFVSATISIDVRSLKNNTAYVDTNSIIIFFRISYAFCVVLSVSVCGANACIFTGYLQAIAFYKKSYKHTYI